MCIRDSHAGGVDDREWHEEDEEGEQQDAIFPPESDARARGQIGKIVPEHGVYLP